MNIVCVICLFQHERIFVLYQYRINYNDEGKKGIYRDNARQRQTKVNILQICKEIDKSVNRK